MKLKIKIKLFGQQHLPELIDKGDFVDLRYGGENTVYLNEGGLYTSWIRSCNETS